MKVHLISVVMVVCLISKAHPKPQGISPALGDHHFRLRFGMNKFAQDLFKAWLDDSNGNVIISPLSIYLAMAMVLYGSPEKSQTNQELLALLGLDPKFYEEYSHNILDTLRRYEALDNIQIANKMYFDRSINVKSNYEKFLEVVFRSPGEAINFGQVASAVDQINAFVGQATKGKIQDLLQTQDITDLTRMILVNAIHFKGTWEAGFNSIETFSKPFFVDDNQSFSYEETMHQEGNFGLAEVNGAQVLEMRYKTPSLKMFIILPNSDQDIRSVDIGTIDFALLHKTFASKKVSLQLPKFKIESKGELKSNLEKLGVTTVFGAKANLSDISNEPLVLSKAIHQARLEVNEAGTEAVGATVVAIDVRVASKEPPSFRVDRPFYAVIYDSVLEVPIFLARIVDPKGTLTLSTANLDRRSADSLINPRSPLAANSQQTPSVAAEAATRKDCRPNMGDIQFPCHPLK
ncbi:hypothetical protein TCAL_11382 [Tigriopus californicus]|uniref:Serpin domain-containing protein n=1 Tax=Tigriopus californicus TaxID=6832 RepID=A0A553NZS1_TIGCA|nr:serine protease inhibitor 42Dd-like [Tigriopus californicus]TRY70931.1 hypothetical protein TCAL_11382 [Tigriopus californicus]|eukprot:TCALIF_11382-PA protein Name:"Similar to SERPINB14 Ovalbumin (Gallus gallus)" AED:0.01 eAED:0.01 QI:0/-1/0/1/-1/1/1/0/461